MPIHTAAAWEGADDHIFVESSRVHGNAFPFFPPNGEAPPQAPIETKADYVRWDIDPTKEDRSSLPDPKVIRLSIRVPSYRRALHVARI